MASHMERAEDLVRLSQTVVRGPGGTSEEAAEFLAEAQVEATLALAEQQRIANVIALGQFRIAPEETPPMRGLVIEPRGEYDVQPRADIRKALGL